MVADERDRKLDGIEVLDLLCVAGSNSSDPSRLQPAEQIAEGVAHRRTGVRGAVWGARAALRERGEQRGTRRAQQLDIVVDARALPLHVVLASKSAEKKAQGILTNSSPVAIITTRQRVEAEWLTRGGFPPKPTQNGT
jgi:hypothetical protein